jgi:hypothetical protein
MDSGNGDIYYLAKGTCDTSLFHFEGKALVHSHDAHVFLADGKITNKETGETFDVDMSPPEVFDIFKK